MITLLLAIALGLVLLAEFIDGSTNKFGFLAYPVFTDSENEYTVINTKKIIHMKIKEVTE